MKLVRISVACLIAVGALSLGATGTAAADASEGASVASSKGCESFVHERGYEVLYCYDSRVVSKETITPAGVTVRTLILDNSYSYELNGLLVDTGTETRRVTFVAGDGQTRVFSFKSYGESYFFGTFCTHKIRTQIANDRLIINDLDVVCSAQ